MTPEQIELARKAMVLEGAPDATPTGAHVSYRSGLTTTPLWDLSSTTPAGWALGGVLLGALGEQRVCVGCSAPTVFIVLGGIKTWRCDTLAEACCRVAVALGRWPGGVK